MLIDMRATSGISSRRTPVVGHPHDLRIHRVRSQWLTPSAMDGYLAYTQDGRNVTNAEHAMPEEGGNGSDACDLQKIRCHEYPGDLHGSVSHKACITSMRVLSGDDPGQHQALLVSNVVLTRICWAGRNAR